MTITVKPLVWQSDGSTMAACLIGIYWFDGQSMHRNGPKVFDNGEHHFGVWEIYRGTDLVEAKAAAQADFNTLILATLKEQS